MLETSDKAVERGIVRIYTLQTEQEQMAQETFEFNGIGFNALDAEFLTSLAEQIQKRGYLTPRQMEFGRKRVLKYAGQLCRISNHQL